ncbi:MAG TPA: DUF2637 domain-containing protein [Actinomycetes bacterium]|jgi:hypothetical protein|nr:DUF2637 domain-containing protein [Actinomycetes bacterium]
MATRTAASPTTRTATPARPGAGRTTRAQPGSDRRRAERLLAALRTTLVVALSALVLAIGALAYLVSFEAIRAFATQTAAFPPRLAWTAPLLVDSFTTAATLVILWRYLRGEPWHAAWYAWTLVAAATAVSVALNVGHAPNHLAARLFAALPPVALLGAVELLMSVARCGLHPATAPARPKPAAINTEALRRVDPATNGRAATSPRRRMAQSTQGRSADNGHRPRGGARARVRELVSRERHGGPHVTVTDVTAATGLKRRRAYELLHEARAE